MPRPRSVVGSIAILLFLGVYVWAATAIGARLPPKPLYWLIFYPIAGSAWGLPLIPLLAWMNRGR